MYPGAMSLRPPTAPSPLDPFAVACDAFTVLGPGVWSSATAVVELGPDGASVDHVVTTRAGAAPEAPGNPEHYIAMLGDALAMLAPPLRGRSSQTVRFTFTREQDGLSVELEPVTPPLKKKIPGHPGHAVLTPELVAAIDEAVPAINARETVWYDAADPDVVPSFAPEGTALEVGAITVPAHLIGIYDARRCHLAWSWEIGGVAPGTAAAMARVRDSCRGRPGRDVIATPGPRPVHDTTAYLLAWLAGLELDAHAVIPLWSPDGDHVMFVAATARPG